MEENSEADIKIQRIKAAKARAIAKLQASKNPTQIVENCSEEKPTQKKYEVIKWNAAARWTWDGGVSNCPICRNFVMDLCIECQSEPDTDTVPNFVNRSPHEYRNECTVAFGVCNHSFHLHCIQRWLTSRTVCPLCNSPWAYNHNT